ncbi:hypothetical protein ACFSUD_03535 [Sulfitobacter aestuarii]|uniref:DUF5655 domain-containing protein n=1 Tax=Sulfitobacter aestuarii TaxID=2161676 RepID=A0ABW5TZA8_9RHOB
MAREAEIGPLDESLKRGQPAWRPHPPRFGSTLRIHWRHARGARLALLIDCRTDLAERMRGLHPEIPDNDKRREIGLDLRLPLPEAAITHLAAMVLGYHLERRL